MVFSSFSGIGIAGMAMAVSKNWIPVEQAGYDEAVMRRFKKNTGVEGRYTIGERQTGADLAYAAVQEVMSFSEVSKKDIKILVYVTQFPDYRVPATACVLHGRLGLPEDCICFDVNQGCSGMVYGLQIVCSLLEKSDAESALLLLGDTSGKSMERDQEKGWLSKEDNNVLLFGNGGGGAILLEKKASEDSIDSAMCTDGKGYKAIIQPYGYFKHPKDPQNSFFNDTAVFDFAIDKPPALIKELMEKIGAFPGCYDCLALHQANKMIMKQVAKRSGFKPEQSIFALDRFANTTSVSILSALVKEYGSKECNERIRAMLCGYGIGLSWGAVSIHINTSVILPLVETDEWFDDGYYS